jgi:hypothetical protein
VGTRSREIEWNRDRGGGNYLIGRTLSSFAEPFQENIAAKRDTAQYDR